MVVMTNYVCMYVYILKSPNAEEVKEQASQDVM